jgi:predicted nucleic acid-binding protein
MTAYFMDSSAISKRYMTEMGSVWVRSLAAPTAGHVIVLAQLALVEVSSALARKQRLAQISAADAAQHRMDFLADVETLYLTVPLEEVVLRQASDLVGRYPLRTLDAVQLACALAGTAILGEPLTFVCADNNLLNAAAGEGLATDNPLAHP